MLAFFGNHELSAVDTEVLHDIFGIHQDWFFTKTACMPSPALHIQPCIQRSILQVPGATLTIQRLGSASWIPRIPVTLQVYKSYKLCTQKSAESSCLKDLELFFTVPKKFLNKNTGKWPNHKGLLDAPCTPKGWRSCKASVLRWVSLSPPPPPPARDWTFQQLPFFPILWHPLTPFSAKWP